MSDAKNYLAFDFGASSGRAILGKLNNGRLELEEIHRFSNDPVEINGHYYWDTFRLFYEIKQGLIKYAQGDYGVLDGIGIDAWGVDFGLIGPSGELLGAIGINISAVLLTMLWSALSLQGRAHPRHDGGSGQAYGAPENFRRERHFS